MDGQGRSLYKLEKRLSFIENYVTAKNTLGSPLLQVVRIYLRNECPLSGCSVAVVAIAR